MSMHSDDSDLMVLKQAVQAYFDRFVDAFASFDGETVGAMFITPGVALKRDGTLQAFAKQGDVEAYYQAALDHYRAQGCTSARYTDLDVRSLGSLSVVGTVSWDLLRADGSVAAHWRQAYFLTQRNGALKAYGSSFVEG